MQAGLVLLCLAYVLSQFYRAFLAVLAGVLERDIGAGPEHLANASGLWFLSFAMMQLPLGWLLDKTGPRRTASALLLIGGAGGAALFALATTPTHISAAMFLIGIGCSPCLMASYYIFAREYPPARFATLAALMLGIGSAGNLVASYPTALAADWIGWRATLWVLALASAAVALGILMTVRDPEQTGNGQKGSVLDLLKLPVMWTILPLMFVNYAPSGALRGLWIGPYLTDTFALDTNQIGLATLAMGIAMIAGTFAFGPMDRIFGTRKWVIFAGNFGSALVMFARRRDPGLARSRDRAVRAGRFPGRHLSGDDRPRPRLRAAAPCRPGRDADEPVRHRRRRSDAVRLGTHPRNAGFDRRGHSPLWRDLHLLRARAGSGLRDLSLYPGQHGLKLYADARSL